MKFNVKVDEKQVTEYFEKIDYLKGLILKAKPELVEEYQALLEQYKMNLENIIIARGNVWT